MIDAQDHYRCVLVVNPVQQAVRSATRAERAGQLAPKGLAHPQGLARQIAEREVAELLLLGMPYRDIGARLFISAKTVEHHVARIRQRLGAGSRSEMLSMLRAMLAPESLTADERR